MNINSKTYAISCWNISFSSAMNTSIHHIYTQKGIGVQYSIYHNDIRARRADLYVYHPRSGARKKTRYACGSLIISKGGVQSPLSVISRSKHCLNQFIIWLKWTSHKHGVSISFYKSLYSHYVDSQWFTLN